MAPSSATCKAVLIGGYHGSWIAAAEFGGAHLSRSALKRFGATPGAGIIHGLGTRDCGLEATAEITAYLAEQSARQCGPCLRGLPQLAELVGKLAQGRANDHLIKEIRRMTGLVEGRGACRHPDGTARMVRSALTAFAGDIDRHRRRQCVAAEFSCDANAIQAGSFEQIVEHHPFVSAAVGEDLEQNRRNIRHRARGDCRRSRPIRQDVHAFGRVRVQTRQPGFERPAVLLPIDVPHLLQCEVGGRKYSNRSRLGIVPPAKKVLAHPVRGLEVICEASISRICTIIRPSGFSHELTFASTMS